MVHCNKTWSAPDVASPSLLRVIKEGVSGVDLGQDMNTDGVELEMSDMLHKLIVGMEVLSKGIRTTPSLWFRNVREPSCNESWPKLIVVPRAITVPVRKPSGLTQVNADLMESCTESMRSEVTDSWLSNEPKRNPAGVADQKIRRKQMHRSWILPI
jgi:hypothetical protein